MRRVSILFFAVIAVLFIPLTAFGLKVELYPEGAFVRGVVEVPAGKSEFKILFPYSSPVESFRVKAQGFSISSMSFSRVYLSDDEIISLNKIMDRYQLVPGRFPLKSEELTKHMGYDKKNRNGVINFVLLEKFASPRINVRVPLDILERAMKETILE